MKSILAFGAVLMVSVSAYAGSRIPVTIIDRQATVNHYTRHVPAVTTSTADTQVTCRTATCSGTTDAIAVTEPAYVQSRRLYGATLALQLPDGRVAVVTCQSKGTFSGDGIDGRDCRVPLLNTIEAEFRRDNAKLYWLTGVDGKKFTSETYKVLAIVKP